VLWRLAGRLLTGPIAFFLAGAIDIGMFALTALRQSVSKRLREAVRKRLGFAATDFSEERE
jgi:hypothetical protein